jgi:hypothetical protein
VVVELYTSQGCSSCPPADEMVATLAADPGVIVLALHVDYWDYIGWADQFAQPKFTERQKGYARAIGSRTIYTPQLIVGGIDRIEGVAPEALAAALARHREAAPRVRLTAVRTGDRIDIRAEAMAPLAAPARVQLVRIDPEETVTIERGENAGRTITYRNIVTDWQAVAEWPGSGPLEIIASAPGDEPAVVIVQEAGPAGILAAARVD